MALYTRQLLSGSTDGKMVVVAATATAGTLLHTAVSGSTSFDEIYLWASNVTASDATLTIEWGGVSDPGDHLVKALNIPANSNCIPIATGQVLNNAKVVRAFSGTASAINISGYVNRIVN
jgi:hypothetical protein